MQSIPGIQALTAGPQACAFLPSTHQPTVVLLKVFGMLIFIKVKNRFFSQLFVIPNVSPFCSFLLLSLPAMGGGCPFSRPSFQPCLPPSPSHTPPLSLFISPKWLFPLLQSCLAFPVRSSTEFPSSRKSCLPRHIQHPSFKTSIRALHPVLEDHLYVLGGSGGRQFCNGNGDKLSQEMWCLVQRGH